MATPLRPATLRFAGLRGAGPAALVDWFRRLACVWLRHLVPGVLAGYAW